MYARLKDPRVHTGLKKTSYSAGSGRNGLKFFVTYARDKDWKRVTDAQKDFLEGVHTVHGDYNSPKCFEFCTDEEFKKMNQVRLSQTATIDDPAAVEAVKIEKEAIAQKEKAKEAFGETDLHEKAASEEKAMTSKDLAPKKRRTKKT